MFVRTRLYAMPVVCAMCVMGGRDSWAQVESPQPGEGTTTPSNPPPQVRDIEVPSLCLGWPDRSRDVSPYFLGHPDRIGPKGVVTILVEIA